MLTTLKAKGAFPENHPLSVGVRGSLPSTSSARPTSSSRSAPASSPTASATPSPTPRRRRSSSARWTRSTSTGATRRGHAVIGDAKLTLQALIDELARARAARARSRSCSRRSAGAKETFLAKFRPWMESTETPINPYRVFGDLMKVLDPEELVRHGRLRQHARPDEHGLRGPDPARLSWAGATSPRSASAWPAAMAAKLAFPDRQCVNVTGDAGVCYMMGNFEAVARYKIGITTIHINNGGYSGLRPRLLGRRPRSLHLEGVRPRQRRAWRRWRRRSASTART